MSDPYHLLSLGLRDENGGIRRALGGFCPWNTERGGDVPLTGDDGNGDMNIWPINFDDVYLRQPRKTLHYGEVELIGNNAKVIGVSTF
jgi:hypothetical protein